VEIEDTKMMHKDAQNQANNNGNPKARKGKVEKKVEVRCRKNA
jgi:hypothetical protein